MKKLLTLSGVIVLLIISGYLILRWMILKPDGTVPSPKSTAGIDLQPLMINKIASIIKDESGGLYSVNIEKLDADVVSSKADLYNVSIVPDSVAVLHLDSLQQLPDDIFTISFSRLHITNITPADLLHKDRIDLDSVVLLNPQLTIYHRSRPYNKQKPGEDSSQTVLQKVRKQFKSIAIKSITGTNGIFTDVDVAHGSISKIFRNVNIMVRDLLLDESTRDNNDRVLLSKELKLSTENYLAKTSDSLYEFKIRSISVDAVKHSLVANDVELLPRGNKAQFEKKLQHMGDMFTLRFPKLEFDGIKWWQLMNSETFICDNAEMYNAQIDDYLDRSLPHSTGGITFKNFPQQLLKQLELQVNVKTLNIHKANVAYEEFAPETEQSGTVYFSDINGTLNNVTNMPAVIKKNGFSTANATAMFMNIVPIKTAFSFDLVRSSGDFTADLETGAMDSSVLNPVTMSLGLVQIKKGIIHSGTVHMKGNNAGSTASVLMLYDDLHVVPLKKESGGTDLKKKTLLSFIANAFILKKNNPKGSEKATAVRVALPRGDHGNYFNFIWNTIRKGILKTLGVQGN